MNHRVFLELPLEEVKKIILEHYFSHYVSDDIQSKDFEIRVTPTRENIIVTNDHLFTPISQAPPRPYTK